MHSARLALLLGVPGLAAAEVPAVLPSGKPAEICVTPLGAAKPVDGPMMHADSRVFDFGAMQRRTSVRHAFVLANYGTKPLEISAVQVAGGCVVDGEWTRTILPGREGTIPIRFDSGELAGPIARTITVVSNDPMRPQGTLELRGVVRLPVWLSSPDATFPVVTDPTRPAVCTITLRHEAAGVLRLEAPVSDQPFFKPELRETVAGREFELRIATVASLETGTHSARIELKTSDPDLPVITVPAVVTVLPPVQVAPSELQLPAVRLTAPETRHLVVFNHRAGDLALSEVRVDAPGVEVAMQRSADGRQFTLTLMFPVGFEAHLDRRLVVRGKTNHASVPTFAVPIIAGSR